MSCCPIEVGEFKETKPIPNNASDKGKQSCEAVRPLALEGNEPQEDIKEQCRPELPADGVLGVPEEVTDLEGLLDLFKEGFDALAAAIQVADTGSSPFKVIGEEDHGRPFAVDLHPGDDAAQPLRILRSGSRSDQGDLVVTDDVAFLFAQSFATDVVAQVVLRPRNPEDAAFGQVKEAGKVDVGFVWSRWLKLVHLKS